MNICKQCAHHRLWGTGVDTDPDFWGYQKGAAFDDDLIPVVDPVSGKRGFTSQNDLRRTYFREKPEDARPDCRDKNPDGTCPKYTPLRRIQAAATIKGLFSRRGDK